ncbi:uncharacterized protein N7511_011086 [Penicillium nucicola]|uniref:uncharacterized protein n=1 Tax=Penicillium nucicola TaxID=1850975 RepID=UPI00254540D9|nr:uncharacterized protein N7511_011086 [Penicillium nucicola]KAJ5742685.1 hypothetical protein N7511_011086 [Penicillium nucicola]
METIPVNCAKPAILQSFSSRKPAWLTGEFIGQYQDIMTTKCQTCTNIPKFTTGGDILEPKRQVRSRSAAPPKGHRFIPPCTEQRSTAQPIKQRRGLLPALTPHQAVVRAGAPSKGEMGFYAPQWRYAVARAA